MDRKYQSWCVSSGSDFTRSLLFVRVGCVCSQCVYLSFCSNGTWSVAGSRGEWKGLYVYPLGKHKIKLVGKSASWCPLLKLSLDASCVTCNQPVCIRKPRRIRIATIWGRSLTLRMMAWVVKSDGRIKESLLVLSDKPLFDKFITNFGA